MAVTRDEIISAALRLLDEFGLEGLSLRRLAGELGISAPTLYWHFRNKRELLDLIAERMLIDYRAARPGPNTDPDPWERLAASFRQQYLAMLSHRDGARVFAGNRPTEAMLPIIDQWLGLWVRIGFTPGEALTSIISLGNYVLGAALEFEAEEEREALFSRPMDERRRLAETYPNLRAAAEARHGRPDRDRHADFEHGLSLLIAGLKARHAELAGASAAPASAAP